MKLSALVVGLVALSSSVFAQSLPPPNGWQHLWVGGGGYVDGLSVPPGTGVRFARTDAGGAYVWNTGFPLRAGWQQLITAQTMDAADWGVNGHGNQVDEIVGSNLNPARAYMYYGGYVFYSGNITVAGSSNITWCRDQGNLAQQVNDPKTSGLFNYRAQGPTLAVDPLNDDHVILGTTLNGLFETFNGTSCSPTWTAIPATSVPLSGIMAYRIAFDPTVSATCHIGSGTCAQNAYIWTNGGGVYATANAGTSWAATTGGPAYVGRMKVSYASAGGGTLWVTDGNNVGHIWRYAAGTWLEMTTPGSCCQSIAINPNNGNEVVAPFGLLYVWVSTNATAPTPTWTKLTTAYAAGDAPWQVTTYILQESGNPDVFFDPLTPNQLIATGGQAAWTATVPSSGVLTWSPQVNGIEELIFSGKLAVSAPGTVTVGVQDEGSCTLSTTNLASNAANCGQLSQLQPLSYASGLSVIPGTSTVCAKVSPDFANGFDTSGCSTDGFLTTYQPFNTWLATVAPSSFANNGSGLIRATVESTVGLTTWAAGSGTIICALAPDLTNAMGTKCFPVTVVNGTTLDLQGSTWSTGAAGTHNTTLFVPATALTSWAGLGTINNIVSDTGALVKITVGGPTVFISNAYPVCISGVSMLGTTVVNGCWVTEKASTNSFDLVGSNFVTGDGYVTGGTAVSWGAPGGGIAMASATNFTTYGGDAVFPMCTNNGGASWTEVDTPTPWYIDTTVTGGPYAAGSTSFTVASGAAVTGSIHIPLASGRTFYVVTGHYTVAGNTVTLTGSAVPPGDSIATGAGVSNSTGWPFAAYFWDNLIAADQVTPNTFYGVNVNFGLIKWTNCNPPVLVTNTGLNGGFLIDTYNGTLRAVPGQAGHLFYTAGPTSPYDVVNSQKLWRTCNGVNSTTNSVTWASVPGFFHPQTVGYGAAAPGKSYPAIIVTGWYDPGNVEANAVYGVWRSVDDASNGSTTTCTGGSWQNLSPEVPFLQGWNTRPVLDAMGDPFVYGPVYLATLAGMWYKNAQ